MQKGPDVSEILPMLCREKGYSQTRLERETKIGHSTMQRYWSGDGGLGLKNGRKIAAVLGVEISHLGLSEEAAAARASTDDRLRELADKLAATDRALTTMKNRQDRLLARMRKLEGALREHLEDVPRHRAAR